MTKTSEPLSDTGMVSLISNKLWARTIEVMIGPMRMKNNMAVARLKNGDLWVWCAIGLTDDVRDFVKSLGGEVRWLVSGNLQHHLFMNQWQEAFPSAKIVVPPRLAKKKRGKLGVLNVEDGNIIGPNGEIPTALKADFECVMIQGIKAPFEEHVWFHKDTSTAFFADIVMHSVQPMMEGLKVNFMQKNMMKMFGIYRRQGLFSPRPPFAMSNRAKIHEGLQKVNDLRFDNLVFAHGDHLMGVDDGSKVRAQYEAYMNRVFPKLHATPAS